MKSKNVIRRSSLVTKENRQDLNHIIHLIQTNDHSRNESIDKVHDFVENNINFSSPVGIAYKERIDQIYSKQEYSDTCIVCNKKTAKNRFVCTKCRDKLEKVSLNPVNIISEAVDEIVDGDGYIKKNGWKDLFSDVFKKHTITQAEEIFTYGTEKLIPKENEMLSSWPKPWLYGMVFRVLLCVFAISAVLAFSGFTVMIPTMFFIGAAVVPMSVLVMLFEINVPRNISFFKVMSILLVGGVFSIWITGILLYLLMPERLFGVEEYGIVDSLFIGIREEFAKFLVVFHYIKKYRKSKNQKTYLLNGMLIGAAVGTGFSIFESAGYAFDAIGYIDGTWVIGQSFFTILIRALLATGGHIAYAAITGFAIVLSCEKKDYKLRYLINKKFLSLFSIVVIIHAMWDLSHPAIFDSLTKLILLTIIAWVIILVLIDNGLDEIYALSIKNTEFDYEQKS